MKKIIAFSFLLITTAWFLFLPNTAQALDANAINDCYVKDLQSEILVQKDSSLEITERVIVDCGSIPDKHGIFRSVPTVYYKEADKKTNAPVELISITNFSGEPYGFSTIKDRDMITWKIGSPNITITGENNYLIKYRVKNTTRFDNPSFDEFYWNINGNFWGMYIDNLSANIIFPEEINKDSVIEINKYDGAHGEKDMGITGYDWADSNTIQVVSNKALSPGEGVTLSVTFPKGIIQPYQPTAEEKMKEIAIILFPIILFMATLLICYLVWSKHGKDIKLRKSITPEFDIPGGLAPMEFGAFLKNASLRTSHISAAIIGLAVKGAIKIEEIPKKGFLSSKDTKLILINGNLPNVTPTEKVLMVKLFSGKGEVLISSLRNSFYKHIPTIGSSVKNELISKNLFSQKGFKLRDRLLIIGAASAAIAFFFIALIGPYLGITIMVCAFVVMIFGALMPKRTPEGAELFWQIKGFKLYMTKAERYRQQFNEKENIFERFLPYAMVFGITGLWIDKMKKIYGEEYFKSYHPVWYAGYVGAFNIDSFTKELNSLSQTMASTMSSSPSSSGSGGGGFSGGGGGGGGGGSW